MSSPKIARMAWRNIWRNRRRTIITLSSIVFGVFLAVLMTSINDRAWADIINLAARLGAGHVSIQHAEYQETPSLTRTVTDSDRLIAMAEADPRVTRAVPRIRGQLMLATAGESFGAGLIAFDPSLEDAESLSILEALSEPEVDLQGRTTGILLGEQLASNLDARIGDRIVYTMTDRHGDIVSGLARLAATISTGSPGVDNGLALLPIDRVRDVLGYADDEVTQIAVFVGDHRQSDAVTAELTGQLSGPAALAWHEAQPELATFVSLKVNGAIVMEVFIAVLVVAGIFNTLFVSVMERLREFGILLAIGFTPGNLFRLVMLESLWIAIVGLAAAAVVTIGPYLSLARNGIDISARMGGTTADVAGVGISPILSVGIYPESVVKIALLAVLATLAAGLYPAWKAGRINPVDTIRTV